jgi:CRP-like cAMP-binding protein
MQDLASSLLHSSEQRLARVLLALFQLPAEMDLDPLAGITQQILADMSGTSRQRVNGVLKGFRRSGLIEAEAILRHSPGQSVRENR